MSFEELIKKLSPTLKRITYRLNGHFSFFNDEDLYQEALVHLWQDFNAGKLNDKTDSYILQGCYFYLKNYIRKCKVRTKLISMEASVDAEHKNLQEALSLEDEASKHYFDCLHNKLLVEAINNNGLSRRERDIFSFCADGLTTREIGRKLGISHVRVVKLMARIREKCRKYRDGS